MTFAERKEERSEYYHKFVKGWKLAECQCCSGGGYYCGNPCGNCEGTGRERSKTRPAVKSNF